MTPAQRRCCTGSVTRHHSSLLTVRLAVMILATAATVFGHLPTATATAEAQQQYDKNSYFRAGKSSSHGYREFSKNESVPLSPQFSYYHPAIDGGHKLPVIGATLNGGERRNGDVRFVPTTSVTRSESVEITTASVDQLPSSGGSEDQRPRVSIVVKISPRKVTNSTGECHEFQSRLLISK